MRPRAVVLLSVVLLLGFGGIVRADPISGVINAQYGSAGGYSYILGTQPWYLGPSGSGASLIGTVSGLSFGTAGDSATGSWLEIGFIATNRVTPAAPPSWWATAAGYPSMFNQSAFLVAYQDSAGHLLVMPADSDMTWATAGGPGGGGAANGTWFDLGTGVTGFGFTLGIVPDGVGPGGTIVLSVDGQTGTRSWLYGICNWRWVGYNTGNMATLAQAEFDTLWQNAYPIAQGYTNAPGGSVYAEISMNAVPEPTSLLLLGSGLVGLARWRKQRR